MSISNTFSYHFYPVGQGLFSTGSIRHEGEEKPRFLWVYDCGTSSGEELVDHGIQRLKRYAGDRNRIDLLTLSHFDHDHIGGVTRLLQEFKVGTLMLPYMPLAQRLIVAFEEGSGGADDLITLFYLNPVDFLLDQGGPGIERILFVMPSGNEGPPYPGELPEPQESGPDDQPRLEFVSGEPEDPDDAGSLMRAAQQKSTLVDFLRPGSRITCAAHLWEFIPYNDDPQEEITGSFVEQVRLERANLLSPAPDGTRADSLRALKKAYDHHFGTGSKERNIISLFLYSGPIYLKWKAWLTAAESCSWPQDWRWRRWPLPDMHAWELRELHGETSRPRCSILYSGDGYLDTNDRLQKLIKYLDQRRVQRIGVFQVMHHGAEANWHQGTAEAIAPMFSVFSSDPERKRWKHPHASVVRDFWRYGTVQVDKDADFTAEGFLSPL